MKISIVDKLKQKYGQIDYSQKGECPNEYLLNKWDKRIGTNWYGFSVEGAPLIWGNIIDEFLQWLESVAPKFEIQQIKVKYGFLRFYVELNIENSFERLRINEECSKLEDWLGDECLIY